MRWFNSIPRTSTIFLSLDINLTPIDLGPSRTRGHRWLPLCCVPLSRALCVILDILVFPCPLSVALWVLLSDAELAVCSYLWQAVFLSQSPPQLLFPCMCPHWRRHWLSGANAPIGEGISIWRLLYKKSCYDRLLGANFYGAIGLFLGGSALFCQYPSLGNRTFGLWHYWNKTIAISNITTHTVFFFYTNHFWTDSSISQIYSLYLIHGREWVNAYFNEWMEV